MAIQKLLVVGSNGLEAEYTPLAASAGAGSAGATVALNGVGQIDLTMMPTGIGPDTVSCPSSDTLTAGMFVSFWNNTGAVNVRKADCTDATKPAQGYVLAGVSIAGTALVYLTGANNLIPLGSFTVADAGAPVFLSTAGTITKTPPAATGNFLQQLGWIAAVSGSYVTVNFDEAPGIVRA